jgi:acyl-CoA synthetase (AMP-forming)/AMP-acid ligase II
MFHYSSPPRCSVVIGTPTMFVDLVGASRRRGTPHRVAVALTAGAPCSPQLFMDIQKHLNVESVKVSRGSCGN